MDFRDLSTGSESVYITTCLLHGDAKSMFRRFNRVQIGVCRLLPRVGIGMVGAGISLGALGCCSAVCQEVAQAPPESIEAVNHVDETNAPDPGFLQQNEEELGDRLIPVYDDPLVEREIFKHVSEEYDLLGQVEKDEVHITVQPHVFSQIGVIDKAGIRSLSRLMLTDRHFADGVQPIVFCDIGSGVGNVLMQVLGEVPQCSRVVGVEIIPSRHRVAIEAFKNAKEAFPQIFGTRTITVKTTNTTTVESATSLEGHPGSAVSTMSNSESSTVTMTRPKEGSFHMIDLVDAAPSLHKDGVNVIFSHSWMFDDDLMAKFAKLINECGPQMRMVVTSRPFVSVEGKPLLSADDGWTCAGRTTLSADWNPKSPFFVYLRN